MRIGDHDHKVTLLDDGTLDTVVRVDGREFRFSQEYAADYREKDGTMTAAGLARMLEDSHDVACWNEEDA